MVHFVQDLLAVGLEIEFALQFIKGSGHSSVFEAFLYYVQDLAWLNGFLEFQARYYYANVLKSHSSDAEVGLTDYPLGRRPEKPEAPGEIDVVSRGMQNEPLSTDKITNVIF